MARAVPKFTEHVKFCRARRSKELVPRVRPKRHHTGQPAFGGTRSDRPQERGEVSTERPDRGAMSRAGLELHDEENRAAGECRGHWLRNATQPASCFYRAD